MLQYIFFDVVVHNFRCCSTYLFMLQHMFFNVALNIFVMLQYLYSDVALHSFPYVCNVVLEVFRALFWDRARWGTGCVGQQGIVARWGAKDRGGFYSIHRGWTGSILFPHERGFGKRRTRALDVRGLESPYIFSKIGKKPSPTTSNPSSQSFSTKEKPTQPT
jgi:hypothetical protein